MSTMSNVGHDASNRQTQATPEWDRLELTVRRLLEEHEGWRRRASAAETRVRELERAVGQLSSGTLDPLALAEQVRTYERENRALLERLAQAREVVERIQARLQFLEEER